MKNRLLGLSMMLLLGGLYGCGGDPACTAAQSQACTDQFGVCQARCPDTDAACMRECGAADCNCHANYRCPAPSGC